jgi:hypothetical protein
MSKRILIGLVISLLLPFSAGAADYYASPSGSSGDGTKGNPWGPAEINWGTLAGANNTLYLFGGTWSGKMEIGHNTTTYTLTIRPCSASPDPSGCNTLVTMTNFIQIGTDAGTRADNVTIDGEKTVGGCSGKALNDTTCRWIKLSGSGMGISDRGYVSSPQQNIKIKYLEITGKADTGHTAYVIGLTDYYSTGTEIAYNYIHDNEAQSDIVTNSTVDAYGGCLIHHNYIINGTWNYISAFKGCDIYNNHFDTTTIESNGKLLYDVMHILGGGPRYVRVYNNDYVGCAEQTMFFENNAGAGAGNKTSKVRIFNNVVNCAQASNETEIAYKFVSIENLDAITGVDDFYIVNNTIANTHLSGGGRPIWAVGNAGGDAWSNFGIQNNIFYNNASGDIALTNVGIASDAAAILDYNLFYKSGGFTFQWINAAHNAVTDYTSISTFNTDHATINHNTGGTDPTFTSSTDFHLTVGSPAAAKTGGVDLSAISDMPAGWPFDKDGTSITGSWSMGAYKYGGGGATVYLPFRY